MVETSAAMAAFAARAAAGVLHLQTCAACGAVAWPPREACSACLSDGLCWRAVSANGTVLAATTLYLSLEDFFRSRLPWRVGVVKLEAGPVAYAHLHARVAEGDVARIEAHMDYCSRPVLIALPRAGEIADDPKLVDLTKMRRNE